MAVDISSGNWIDPLVTFFFHLCVMQSYFQGEPTSSAESGKRNLEFWEGIALNINVRAESEETCKRNLLND